MRTVAAASSRTSSPSATFRPAARSVLTARGSRAASPAASVPGLDALAAARAAAAAEHEAGKWESLIESVAQNPGLSRAQCAALITALRQQQQAAAQGARQRVMEEAQQNARAYRRSLRAGAGRVARAAP